MLWRPSGDAPILASRAYILILRIYLRIYLRFRIAATAPAAGPKNRSNFMYHLPYKGSATCRLEVGGARGQSSSLVVWKHPVDYSRVHSTSTAVFPVVGSDCCFESFRLGVLS